MNEIKVVPENALWIDQILCDRQQDCKARLLNYKAIEEGVLIAESILENILSKQYRQNVLAIIRPSYPAFNPYYRGTPEHTECLVRRGKKYWYITGLDRAKAVRKGSVKVEIIKSSLTKKHHHILEHVTKNLGEN